MWVANRITDPGYRSNWTQTSCWLTSAPAAINGSSKNLFYCFRRFDNRWRDCRLYKSRQCGVDYCGLNYWSAIARSSVSVARTSQDWIGDCACCVAFACCAVCPQISADRKSDACGNDVDP